MATSNSKPRSKNSKSPTISKPLSSLPSHIAMVELKSCILASLSKLFDCNTHQIAVDNLEKIIRTLPSDAVPMLLNSLTYVPPSDPNSFVYHRESLHLLVLATSHPDPTSDLNSSVYRHESLRLLAFLVASHPNPTSDPNSYVYRHESLRLIALRATSHLDPTSNHVPKIMTHIAKRLKDPTFDSLVRDSCRDTAGFLAGIYLKGQSEGSSSVVGLFLKTLLEVMGEPNKAVQAGAAGCLTKVVECTGDGATTMFQRLCPRICKLVGRQRVLAKGSLLSMFPSLGIKLWLFIAYVVSFVSLAGAVGMLVQDALTDKGPSSWTGVAGILQCVFVLISGLMYWTVHSEE